MASPSARVSAPERVTVVILAKDTGLAKSRLGLKREHAARLAFNLAVRTVRTVLTAASTGAVVVVTGDREIARTVSPWGVVVVPEEGAIGINRAAAIGAERAAAERPRAPTAIMVADLPALRPEDLDEAVEEFRIRQVPLHVADHLGDGTTFIIYPCSRPPGIAFGLNSASMHNRLGYAPARGSLSGLRRDLDTPDDLRSMRSLVSSLAGGETSS